MFTLVQNLGDRLLARLVPQTHAVAYCTPRNRPSGCSWSRCSCANCICSYRCCYNSPPGSCSGCTYSCWYDGGENCPH